MSFVKLCDVTPTRVQWLWPGRLPSGHLAMIDGDTGLGKSFVTLDLCARISAGEPFPDGAPTALRRRERGNCILFLAAKLADAFPRSIPSES